MSESVWNEVANAGGRLSPVFVKTVLMASKPHIIQFDREDFSSQSAIERADVKVDTHVYITLSRGLPSVYIPRLRAVLIIIERFVSLYSGITDVSFSVALGDETKIPECFNFSSSTSGLDMLLPDPDYLLASGYANEIDFYVNKSPEWKRRIDKIYWRGTDTGLRHYEDKLQAPRMKISFMSVERSDIIDAKITALEPRSDSAEMQLKYQEWGILGEREPQEKILDFRYQIDIDGNSNAWRSLFLKLLSGSPVFKVNSDLGYRQWYYNRLAPWINYVPVKSDLSDLLINLEILKNTPSLAESISARAREMVMSLTFDSQVNAAAAAILKYVKRL